MANTLNFVGRARLRNWINITALWPLRHNLEIWQAEVEDMADKPPVTVAMASYQAHSIDGVSVKLTLTLWPSDFDPN